MRASHTTRTERSTHRWIGALVVGLTCGWLAPVAIAQELQNLDLAAIGAEAAVAQAPPAAAATEATNPWSGRPACASMFIRGDWQLTSKQKACNWFNGVMSTNAMLGAVWSAKFSQYTDQSSEQGDGFATRFGRKFGQSAVKSTASYLGAMIAREDPRKSPPYLAMRTRPPARGFFKRTAAAIGGNFISHTCVERCTSEKDIKNRPALSKVLGSLGSGFAGELLTHDRPNTLNNALRGSASAYGSTFVNALFVEFKPELSAFGGRIFRFFGSGR